MNDDILKVDDYLFVFKNGGWWLKITEPKQLFNYHDKTDSKWSECFFNLINSKEFTEKGTEHAKDVSFAVGMYASNRGLSFLDAIGSYKADIVNTQLDCLLKYGELYINRKGGYHFKTSREKEYTQFVRRKELIFPEYKESDIRVKQFQGGEHWYAYIGDTQVKDGDICKWNTYEEAYEKAKQIVS